MTAKKCWQVRGCPEDMKLNCMAPKTGSLCGINCYFTSCPTEAMDIVENFAEMPIVDVSQYGVVKNQCLTCRVMAKYVKNQQDPGGDEGDED